MRAAALALLVSACALAPPPAPPTVPGLDMAVVNRAGQDVDLDRVLVRGKVTVVDF